MAKQDVLQRWSVKDSADLYGIKDWGAGYFDLNAEGEVVVCSGAGAARVEVSLMDVIKGIRERGMSMPVLLRVENFLDSQISLLNDSFARAMQQSGYEGRYQGVFPIKVNQQAQVIEEIARFGARFDHGLEAGSKAELIIALAMIPSPKSLIVCNGYKDEEFIDLGLYAVQMGYKCFFVVETPAELPIIMKRSAELGVDPYIGVRLKLSSRAGGHWQDSGGEGSIFGLTTNQLIEIVDTLRETGKLHCLQLLHYHLGSQIPNIRDIRQAVRETVRFYADMVKEGAPMGYLDLGGGLGVDYDGSQTNFVHSRNYSLDEYCSDVMEVIVEVLNEQHVAHPTVITESGRATVAYSSILLFDVLDTNRFEAGPIPDVLPDESPEMLENLWLVRKSLNLKNVQECYNDAIYYREEISEQFRLGAITLRQRALADNVFIDIIHQIAASLDKIKRVPRALDGLQNVLHDIYYANMSVFQSLPDAWAIDQIFPIMPVHRLREEPERRAIFADITCDSDGKIDKFPDMHDVRTSIPVHELGPGEEYFMGVFLVGAYQETLGDLHNLLGDTNVVSIRINENGGHEFVREIEGDSIWDVLTYVEYEPKALISRFRNKAEDAVQSNTITVAQRRQILKAFEESIRGYTYFER
ncbi:MAG: biosynthetic arginine decarboxylase [Kiritimatiellia bacterium]